MQGVILFIINHDLLRAAAGFLVTIYNRADEDFFFYLSLSPSLDLSIYSYIYLFIILMTTSGGHNVLTVFHLTANRQYTLLYRVL